MIINMWRERGHVEDPETPDLMDLLIQPRFRLNAVESELTRADTIWSRTTTQQNPD